LTEDVHRIVDVVVEIELRACGSRTGCDPAGRVSPFFTSSSDPEGEISTITF
jgi:hypothetical protein